MRDTTIEKFDLYFYSVTKIDGGLVFVAEFEDDMCLNSNLLDDWVGQLKGNDFVVISQNSNLQINYKNLSGCNGALPTLLARCLMKGYVAVLLHEHDSEDGYLIHISANRKVTDGEVTWEF